MIEYIPRKAAIAAVIEARMPDTTPDGIPIANGKRSVSDCVRRIKDIPAVDVQPVKWISVTERLPDFEGMCLCMRKSYSKANFRHQEIMYFDYDEQAFCSNVDGIFVADGNVTHWMPLPEPPKDGEA